MEYLHRAWEYLKFGVDFFILRKKRPYILGLVTNDTCNLSCKHCRVANIDHVNMSYEKIKSILERYYRNGSRFVYIEGGEPYMWHDEEYRLKDIVTLAKKIGYLQVHIYTNGTFPLDANPDFTYVSIDGLKNSYETIRGIPIERVLDNIRSFKQKFAIIFVVNTINRQEIRPFLEFIQNEFPSTRVMFYFHTPYYGIDSLFLSKEQKREAIDTIIRCKKDGLPVFNSKSGLRAIMSGNYEHPTNLWWIVDHTGEYQCCRAFGQKEVCEECGYSSCAEIVLARSYNIGAIKEMFRYFW